jgi:hypothetical protein
MMKIGRSLAQLDIEALQLVRQEPGCAQVFAYRIGEKDYGGGELVLGQADKDVAERGMQIVQRLLHERYGLDIRD